VAVFHYVGSDPCGIYPPGNCNNNDTWYWRVRKYDCLHEHEVFSNCGSVSTNQFTLGACADPTVNSNGMWKGTTGVVTSCSDCPFFWSF